MTNISTPEVIQGQAPEEQDGQVSEPKYLLDKLLKIASITMVKAKSGIDLTWFLLALAFGMTRREKVFDRFTCENPCNVLYVEGTMHQDELQSRLDKLNQEEGDYQCHLFSFNKIFRDTNTYPSILDAYTRNLIEAEVKKFHGTCRAIILDNATTLCKPGNDKTSSLAKAVKWILHLRDKLDLAVIIGVPETKSNSKNPLVQNEDADLILQLIDTDKKENLQLLVEFEKSRFLNYKDRIFFFNVELISDDDGTMSWKSSEDLEAKRFLACYLSQAGMIQNKIATKIEKKQNTVSDYVNDYMTMFYDFKDGKPGLNKRGKELEKKLNAKDYLKEE